MRIHGLQKLTLLDYPEKVAAALFLGGCNFRCPFCQNSGLVLNPDAENVIPYEELLAFLKKRQGILDGICITGGEPTLEKDLELLIRDIRSFGYLVKLDTNGSRPEVLKDLVKKDLLDYVAMDIKSSLQGYEKTAGLATPSAQILERIQESADFLMHCGIEYEFRTTVMKELHTASDFSEIADWLAGCRRYYLQAYQDSEHILLPGIFHSYTRRELENFREILLKKIPLVGIRGIDE
ncbi:MAG: anaerobic ribonucleoside-triphosphate reductase activating protein [Candidatus Limivivens sp.]|nr:anaerobic ribonucleoside-triphosphate reductase activating protein [Candidatus Limivivens sp.]